MQSGPDLLRELPAIAGLLDHPALAGALERHGRSLVTRLVREQVAELRDAVAAGRLDAAGLARRAAPAAVALAVEREAEALLTPRPRRVLNATGVVVHTNLGRSVLSPAAAARVAEVAAGYVDLEYDVARGGRGSRGSHLSRLIELVIPGAASLVVNNNAAAIMLALRALAGRREVIVSRGELVEIGGSFRVPDIMRASGARLREVGTTNRTRLGDYEAGLGPRTGAILKVHTSNFRIVGFAEETSIADLSGLARRAGVPLIVDWGSGDLVDLEPLGIRDETPVRDVLAAGADLVTFSGDKLFGGPQAGFVVGREDLVARLRRDPLARVCRLDRLLVAALHATLAAYARGRALDEVPTLAMLALTPEAIGRRAEAVRDRVAAELGDRATLAIVDGVSRTGGGSSPTGERPTRLLAVTPTRLSAAALERRLRAATPPVIARVHDDRVLLDLRTVLADQDAHLAAALTAALGA